MLIVQSQSTDIYRNLAVEDWLLDHAPQLPVLFLCVNEPCVVIGKNQNPWRECRLSLMEEEGILLARRTSGGGAVYHDPGNLNVGVIVPRTQYRAEKQYELIFQTLEATAFRHKNLSKLGKNSLGVDGKKFSGQAFCYRKDRVLHHGTLLVNANLDRLGRYLGPELDGIETNAVASIPAKVMNLSEVAPELTIGKLSSALIETFGEMYGLRPGGACAPEGSDPGETRFHGTGGMIPEEEMAPMVEKLSSKAWTLEHTPKFTFQCAEVEKGRITNMEGNPLFEEWLNQLSL